MSELYEPPADDALSAGGYDYDDPRYGVFGRDTGAGLASSAPPQDVAAEQSVLGAMLLSKDAIDPATDVLMSRDFYRPEHETIFDTIVDLSSRGQPVDAITVSRELERRGELTKVGGAVYLSDLVAAVPITANVDYHAEIVHEKAVLRRLADVGRRIAQSAHHGQGSVSDLVDAAQKDVLDVDGARGGEDYRTLANIIPTTIDEIEQIQNRDPSMTGVMSGFADLDRFTTGFRPGQMIVVAARPGVGKSTLGLDFVRHAAIRNDVPCAFFSLEMTASEIAMRLISAEARVSIGHIRGGQMSQDEDWAKISRVLHKVQNAPIVIDDSPNMTMPEIRAKARRIKKEHGLGFVVLDYLQLMTSGQRVENRQVEVSDFSRQIKLLAKELEVPIVAISQLNRGSEQRNDKTPQLSDLRESGAIEQDADIVMLVHRPDAHAPDNISDRPGEADIILAKNRSGQTGRVTVTFQGHYSKFTQMARNAEPAAVAAQGPAGASASEFEG